MHFIAFGSNLSLSCSWIGTHTNIKNLVKDLFLMNYDDNERTENLTASLDIEMKGFHK